MQVNKWDKFYRIKEDDSIEFLRLIRVKNEDCFVMLNSDKEKIKLTADQLSKYVKLRPDGYINYSIVYLDAGIRDVIVSMFRRVDIEDGDVIPYCICRQNIFDLFTNNFVKDNKTQFVGCSVSKDTCPADIDYKMIMGCNSIIENINISMYVDDTLDDLLEPITLLNFNDILFKNYIKNKDSHIHGYCKSLKELLYMNNFMYDVLKAFNIIKVPFTVLVYPDSNELHEQHRKLLENYFKVEMFKTFVVPFTKEIDLKKIERDHVIISDNNDNIFIILYDKGDFIDINSERQFSLVRDQIIKLKEGIDTI